MAGNAGHVRVLERQRIEERTGLVIKGRNPRRILEKVGREQWNPVVEEARAGADHGLSVFPGGKRQTNSGCEGRRAADGLAGQTTAQIERQPIIQYPVVLNKFGHPGVPG